MFELLGPKYYDKSTLLPKWLPFIWQFLGQKSLLEFLNVGLELFKSYLGIVFALDRPNFRLILKVDIWPLKSKVNIWPYIWLFSMILVQKMSLSQLFQSCSWVAQEVLGHCFLKLPLLRVFSGRMFDKLPRKSRLFVKFWPLIWWFLTSLVVKKYFLGLFRSCLRVV